MKYDFLVVGTGLSGATFAREMTNSGKKCLVIDRRQTIGGNVYTKEIAGIHTHMYGPHIFNTNSPMLWGYVNNFTPFNDYRHRVKCSQGGTLYSFPINLNTLEELWGDVDQDLLRKLNTEPKAGFENLEEYAIENLGEEIYRKFIYGYTKKQWGKEPRNLPALIISRIPIRKNRNDDYHKCIYSGVPKEGYSTLIENMLDGIEIRLDVDYLNKRDYWDGMAKVVVYTGPIDEFFNYTHGDLDWRSLRFDHEVKQAEWLQPVAQINYTDEEIKYTRTIEHKHFYKNINTPQTVITTEYPQEYNRGQEKYYPVNDTQNTFIYSQYKKMIDVSKYIFIGRLATYKYYNMDQAIAAALKVCNKIKDNI